MQLIFEIWQGQNSKASIVVFHCPIQFCNGLSYKGQIILKVLVFLL